MVTASACCSALLSVLHSQTSLPGSQVYNTSLGSYFSAQELQLKPACVVSVNSSTQVSVALRTLAELNCDFAIRSGGHAPGAGTANIDSGVTLDLSDLDNISLSHDKSVISAGPGALWADVYAVLEPQNLIVAGGRVSTVGVGGLSIGGGISFFSPRYGFTCDTIVNFEVVLANGAIVNTNTQHNSDLLHALRGGSNNFGVVTRVDLKTYEQGPFWGGNVLYGLDTAPQQLKAISELASASQFDEYASLISAFALTASGGAVSNTLQYTKNVENPVTLKPFVDIPHFSSSLRIANASSFASEGNDGSPPGHRVIFSTITHGSSEDMLNATYTAWSNAFTDLKDIPGIEWALLFEPLPPAIYNKAKTGSNVLGLSGQQENLMVLLLSAGWDNESDDLLVMNTTKKVLARIKSDATKLGEDNDYLYLNYAADWQKPIASYGRDNVAKLQRVSRMYDPLGIFQKHVPGGFKLF